MENYNKLYDTNDSIEFGQMKDEPFKWIYLLNKPYLIWLIRETNICFTNLEFFKNFGNPLIFNDIRLSKDNLNKFYDLFEQNGVNNFSGSGSKSFLITIEIYVKAIELNYISKNDFITEDFEFTKELIEINNEKLENCKPHFYLNNLNRNEYLTKLFL